MHENRKGSLILPLPMALNLLLATACATFDEPLPSGAEEPKLLHATPLPDGRLQLTLPLLPPEPAFERFSAEDAHRVLAQFHEDLARLEPGMRRRASMEACIAVRALRGC